MSNQPNLIFIYEPSLPVIEQTVRELQDNPDYRIERFVDPVKLITSLLTCGPCLVILPVIAKDRVGLCKAIVTACQAHFQQDILKMIVINVNPEFEPALLKIRGFELLPKNTSVQALAFKVKLSMHNLKRKLTDPKPGNFKAVFEADEKIIIADSTKKFSADKSNSESGASLFTKEGLRATPPLKLVPPPSDKPDWKALETATQESLADAKDTAAKQESGKKAFAKEAVPTLASGNKAFGKESTGTPGFAKETPIDSGQRDQAFVEKTAEGEISTEKSPEIQGARDAAFAKEASANQASANQASANQASANQASANQASANQASANQASANQASANQASANQASANQASANQASADQERSVDEVFAKETPIDSGIHQQDFIRDPDTGGFSENESPAISASADQSFSPTGQHFKTPLPGQTKSGISLVEVAAPLNIHRAIKKISRPTPSDRKINYGTLGFLLKLPKQISQFSDLMSAYTFGIKRVGKMTNSEKCLLITIDEYEQSETLHSWSSKNSNIGLDETIDWAQISSSTAKSHRFQCEENMNYVCKLPEVVLNDEGHVLSGLLCFSRPIGQKGYNSDETALMNALASEINTMNQIFSIHAPLLKTA